MRRLIACITSALLLLLILFPVTASADMGPKPSVTINVRNFESQSYKLDLLVKESDTSLKYENFNKRYPETLKDTAIYKYREGGWIAAHIRDSILWGSLTGTIDTSGNIMVHKFSYFGVPKTFKVIMEYDNGKVLVSDEITPGQFNAQVVYDAKSNKIYTIPNNMQDMINPIKLTVITILIELLLALIFRISPLWLVVLVNFLTQVILQAFMYGTYYIVSPESIDITFLVLEVIIPFVEYLLYKKFARPVNKKRLISYVITANIITLIVGILMI
jgi:hypothetical protein